MMQNVYYANNGLIDSNAGIGTSKLFRKRIISIDIIKGIAMIMVILVHFNQSFKAANIPFFRFGQMGCQMFFVASGFGAAISFSKKIAHNTLKKATMDFYISRIKAIAPAWWFMLVVVFLINTIVIKITGHTLNIGSNRSPAGIICNALFLHGLNPFCNNNVMPGGWYIGTTMILYALSPLIILLFSKNSPVKFCILSSAVSILCVMMLTYVAHKIDPRLVSVAVNNNSFGYFSFLTQYPSFSMGILLYHYYSSTDENTNIKRSFCITDFLIGCALLICGILLFFNPFFLFSYIFCASLVGLSAFFVLKAMIFAELAGRSFDRPTHKLMALFGKESYYIYLVHAFFAYTFVSICKKVLSIVGFNGDSYIVFIILFPVVCFLSYFCGIVLKKITDSLKSKIWA